MAQAEEQGPLVKLLGPTLLGKNGDVPTSSLEVFDAVGVYFSAHWCPPCRGFTPKLIETYNKMQSAGKKFEVIFISSDRDQKAFDEYYGEMPWIALKYEDRKRKAKISKKFKVNGIPSFQILDPKTGKILTDEGRDAVGSDSDGSKFPEAPWKKPETPPFNFFEALAGKTFAGQDGKELTVEDVRKENKYLMLYFSAHWCPPCRGFTPKFAEWYKKNQPAKKGTDQSFETVFVSSDRDKAAFDSYFGEQPWLALPYSERELKGTISTGFDVQGIPTLVVLDCESGKMLTDAGRGGVDTDPEAAKFPWPKESAVFLGGGNVAPINDTPMLVIFAQDGNEEQQEACLAAVKTKADPMLAVAQATEEDMEVEFRVDKGEASSGFTNRLKGLGVKDGQICIIFDIGSKQGFAHPDIKTVEDVTAERIAQFVDDFIAEKLEGFPLTM